jgi:hypothetical protein
MLSDRGGFNARHTTMTDIKSIYPVASEGVRRKILTKLDAHCRSFIQLSPFVCIGSADPEGLPDVSPRGGDPGFVRVIDYTTLALPDWPGNNLVDTLTNVSKSPCIGMLFFIPGINETLRVNGSTEISFDATFLASFATTGRTPRSALIIYVREAFLHCTKALKRAELWNSERHQPRGALPTFGEMLRDQMKLPVPAGALDAMLEADAKHNLY